MLNVGEVIYLLDKKTQAVIPCMIVEKVNSISLEGETTHHVIVSPSGKKIRLENYKSPWFSSPDEARSFLLEASSKLIDRVISDALKTAKASFETAASPDEEVSVVSESQLTEDVQNFTNDVIVDLGNGQTAKVTMPPEVE